MIRKTIALAIAACTLLACKKSDPEVKPQPKDSYYPLAIGNQWVYDIYAVSNDDKETLLPSLRDTVTIVKDTMINGKSYYRIKSSFKSSNSDDTFIHTQFASIFNDAIRDSSGYVVNSVGMIRCSPNPDNYDTLNTYVGIDLTHKTVMKDSNKELTVPAGTFKVVALERYVSLNGSSLKRTVYEYFAKNVGPIYNHVLYLSDGKDGYRQKLVAYHLK